MQRNRILALIAVLISGLVLVNAQSTATISVPGATFIEKMRWLTANVQTGGNYIIEFDTDQRIAPTTLSFSGRNNISITITSTGPRPVVLSLSANGSMFTVASGVTLILDGNLELRGINDNSHSLIWLNAGNLIMNNGKISGNTAIEDEAKGGGVYVSGTFIMNGGEISGNFAVADPFCITGESYGGGVYVNSGTFTMNGGTISGNIVTTSGFSSGGGGVYVNSGTFTMNDGTISGNIAPRGGGVLVKSGTFTMSTGTISGNIATRGGGVEVNSGIFTMSSGEISGNSAEWGGGLLVDGTAVFTKTGGTIFGYPSNAARDSSGVIQSGRGHAVYVDHFNSIYKLKKDSTSGPTDNLSYNGSSNPPASSGAWE